MITSKTPLPRSDGWVYVGKYKDGKPKLRKHTHQSDEHVANYLNEQEIPFEYQESVRMFRIHHPTNGKVYQYFYTTGQWGMYFYGKRPDKHYHSNSIEEFVTKYLFKEYKNEQN